MLVLLINMTGIRITYETCKILGVSKAISKENWLKRLALNVHDTIPGVEVPG